MGVRARRGPRFAIADRGRLSRPSARRRSRHPVLRAVLHAEEDTAAAAGAAAD